MKTLVFPPTIPTKASNKEGLLEFFSLSALEVLEARFYLFSIWKTLVLLAVGSLTIGEKDHKDIFTYYRREEEKRKSRGAPPQQMIHWRRS